MSGRTVTAARIDFYKVLKVQPSASVEEIKKSYRRLALEYHPDRNNGCRQAQLKFQQISEAYAVLIDTAKRADYDLRNGQRFNINRREAPPPNYRKVYTPRPPPPEWKKTWDHAEWYRMHYGDGMMKDHFKRAKRSYEREHGPIQYESPLGRGFYFSSDPKKNVNPYSSVTEKERQRAQEGFTFYYEERNSFTGESVRRKIVEDLHGRRRERHMKQDAAANDNDEEADDKQEQEQHFAKAQAKRRPRFDGTVPYSQRKDNDAKNFYDQIHPQDPCVIQ